MEITWDYSTTMDEPGWELECRCGNQNGCRKQITSFQYLPKERQKYYIDLGIVPTYIQKYSAPIKIKKIQTKNFFISKTAWV